MENFGRIEEKELTSTPSMLRPAMKESQKHESDAQPKFDLSSLDENFNIYEKPRDMIKMNCQTPIIDLKPSTRFSNESMHDLHKTPSFDQPKACDQSPQIVIEFSFENCSHRKENSALHFSQEESFVSSEISNIEPMPMELLRIQFESSDNSQNSEEVGTEEKLDSCEEVAEDTLTDFEVSMSVSTLQATEVEMSLFVVENDGRNVPPSTKAGIHLLDSKKEYSGIQEDDWVVVTDSDLQKLLEDNEYTQNESYMMNNPKEKCKAMMNRYRFDFRKIFSLRKNTQQDLKISPNKR